MNDLIIATSVFIGTVIGAVLGLRSAFKKREGK